MDIGMSRVKGAANATLDAKHSGEAIAAHKGIAKVERGTATAAPGSCTCVLSPSNRTPSAKEGAPRGPAQRRAGS